VFCLSHLNSSRSPEDTLVTVADRGKRTLRRGIDFPAIGYRDSNNETCRVRRGTVTIILSRLKVDVKINALRGLKLTGYRDRSRADVVFGASLTSWRLWHERVGFRIRLCHLLL